MSAHERETILRRASERAEDLQRAIGEAFPELRRVSVSLGTSAGVDEDGREVHAYSFGANLYVSSDERPDVSLSLKVTSNDEEVAIAVEEALARIPKGRSSE